MTMSENWAPAWVARKLGDFEGISTKMQSNGVLVVERRDNVPFMLGEPEMVLRKHVEALLDGARGAQFVVNVPNAAIWSGGAIELVHGAPAAFGGMSDLQRALQLSFVSDYRNKIYSFVEEGLQQHTAVQSLERIYDRVFKIHRRSRRDLTVVLVDAYYVSAEDIRNARRKYGQFDAVLKTTSYGGASTAGEEAPKSIGAEIFKWGEFLGRLNKS